MQLLYSLARAIKSIALFISEHADMVIFDFFSYVFFAGLLYLIFYIWKREELRKAKIQVNFPSNKHILRDIKYSISSIIIFGAIGLAVVWASDCGLTLIYTPIYKYGYVYYFFSIFLMIIVHDAYFYWTHRLLHWKRIFKWTHQVHHLTYNPTPFSAYAFHPIEAIVQAGILPLIAFTIPAHVSAIAIFLIHQMLLNVAGHLGHELTVKGTAQHKFFKWFNTSTHHNMHHSNVKYNFGIYFNFWDRIMQTNHPQYEDNFDKIIARRMGKDVSEAIDGSKRGENNTNLKKS